MTPNTLINILLSRLIGLCLTFFISLPAQSATLSLEGYRHHVMSKRLSETNDKVDLYVDGIKVLSEKVCTEKNPCKLEITKKAILTLCNSEVITRCQTGIQFDPTRTPIQRYAFIASQNSYDLTPYIIFSPPELTVIDAYLGRQAEEEKQRDEMKNRVPN